MPSRVCLIQLPTPLHRLDRLSDRVGVDLWIKRDDLTGFALGGNKGRKLEYLLADVIESGADTVVTCGAIQSNFIRQLTAACAVSGLKCAAVAMALPYDVDRPRAGGLNPKGGNELLDELLGLDLRVLPDGTWDDLYDRAESLACEYERAGAKVYRMPIGGSTPLGAYAFLQAAEELRAQCGEPFDSIVFASSSGSTHTGLLHGFRGSPTRIVGIACDPEPSIADDFAKLSDGLTRIIGGLPLTPSDFELDFRFVGPGYGIQSHGSMDAVRRLARAEGIFLDPIYSGKAFHGLLARIAAGETCGRVLFWHTGGVPALFAMPADVGEPS